LKLNDFNLKMVVCFIIAFKYERRLKELPGIVIDIYRIYQIAKRWHTIYSSLDLFIITDIQKDEAIRFLKTALLSGIVDEKILSFIQDRYNDNTLIFYTDKSQLLGMLRDQCYKESRIFLYYTGHGKNGNFVLPNSDYVSLNEIRGRIVSKSNPDADIFIVLDCCNATNMNLLYQYNGDKWVFNKSENIEYVSQNLILITSTLPDEESVATETGSIFTYILYEILLERIKDLDIVYKKISDACIEKINIHPSIYSSYGYEKKIWDWVVGDNLLPIKYDENMMCILWGHEQTPREKEKHLNYCELIE